MKFVYLMRSGNEYKVGIANNLKKRLSSIQTSNAKKIELVCARRAINASILEKSIHDKLKEYGGNGGREWFTLTPQKAIEVAVNLNSSPEVETSDLIIEDLSLDLRKVIASYWENVEREMRRGGVLTKPIVIKQPVIIKGNQNTDPTHDPLWEDALTVLREDMRASTSLLQRKLKIGYGRASRLMDDFEEAGIIGPSDGAKARAILVQTHDI